MPIKCERCDNPTIAGYYSRFCVSCAKVNHERILALNNEHPDWTLQAIGNIAPSGIKNDILLIREEDGVRTYRKLDITKIDLINGPYYYLKQNDIIYVKPNGPAVLQSGWLTSIASILGLISSVFVVYLLFTR